MKNALQNLALIVVGLLVGFAIVEAGFRIAAFFTPSQPSLAAVSADGLAAYIPNTDQMHTPEDVTDGAPVRNLVNAQGFVGATDFVEQKSPGVTRIAALGDSFTAALGVNTETNFISQLERGLQTTHPTEIYNFGVGGQGTIEESIRYGKSVVRYKPDIVAVFFFPNDFENNQFYIPYEKQLASDSWTDIPPSNANNNIPRTDFKFIILSYSKFLQYLDTAVRGNNTLEKYAVSVGLHHAGVMGVATDDIPPSFFIYERPLPATHQEVFDFTATALALLKKRVEANGSRLVLVYLPEGLQVSTKFWEEKKKEVPALATYTWDFDQTNIFLKAVAEKNAIPYLDLTPVFRSYLDAHPDAHLHAHNDGHFNQLGHDVAVSALIPFFASLSR